MHAVFYFLIGKLSSKYSTKGITMYGEARYANESVGMWLVGGFGGTRTELGSSKCSSASIEKGTSCRNQHATSIPRHSERYLWAIIH